MLALATTSTADIVLPLRVRYRQEMNGQIVHDSIRNQGTYESVGDGTGGESPAFETHHSRSPDACGCGARGLGEAAFGRV